jgi:hypothetical protein
MEKIDAQTHSPKTQHEIRKQVIRLREQGIPEQIEVFHLPSYSPKLHPDEYLNENPKNKVHPRKPVRNREDLEKKTRSFMKTLIRRQQMSEAISASQG